MRDSGVSSASSASPSIPEESRKVEVSPTPDEISTEQDTKEVENEKIERLQSEITQLQVGHEAEGAECLLILL